MDEMNLVQGLANHLAKVLTHRGHDHDMRKTDDGSAWHDCASCQDSFSCDWKACDEIYA